MVISLYNEKRDSVRVRSLHLLSFSLLDKNDVVQESGMGRTLNISEEGILAEVYTEVLEGARLEILLTVADESILAKGICIRSLPQGGKWKLAIELEGVNPGDYEKINSYLDNNFPYTREFQ